MSTTIIENLFAQGDVPSGQYARILAALDTLTGTTRVLRANSQNSLYIAPGRTNGTGYGEFRTASPIVFFDSRQFYGKDSIYMVESLTGGGTSTFQTNRACVRMQCGTASGDKVVRQTKPYLDYQSNRTILVILNCIIGAAKTNVRQRAGVFDDDNGIFLEQTTSGISLVHRTKVTGSVVDTAIPQTSWNLDPLDGSGSSGITLDLSKIQSVIIARVWPGIMVLVFFINGEVIFAHFKVDDNNYQAQANSGTPALPGRLEIENTGATASATYIDQYTVTAQLLGGFSERGPVFSTDTGTTARANGSGNILPLIAVRLKSAYSRAVILPNAINLYQSGTVRAHRIQVNVGGSLTGGAWVSISDAVEANISATAISGGSVIKTLFTAQDASYNIPSVNLFGVPISSNFAGTADILTMVCTNLTGSSANLFGAIDWEEIL